MNQQVMLSHWREFTHLKEIATSFVLDTLYQFVPFADLAPTHF
jgi:hypothetical protein